MRPRELRQGRIRQPRCPSCRVSHKLQPSQAVTPRTGVPGFQVTAKHQSWSRGICSQDTLSFGSQYCGSTQCHIVSRPATGTAHLLSSLPGNCMCPALTAVSLAPGSMSPPHTGSSSFSGPSPLASGSHYLQACGVFTCQIHTLPLKAQGWSVSWGRVGGGEQGRKK